MKRAITLVGGILLIYLVPSVIRILVWRSHWQPALDVVRWFNKRTPAMWKRPGKGITVVHHTGRKSGTEYLTPVWGERVGRSFYIQLPYGINVDWCRNVLADGGCTLERDGARFDTIAPVIVPAAAAVPHLPPGLRRMQRLADVRSYLRLDITPAESPDVGASCPHQPAPPAITGWRRREPTAGRRGCCRASPSAGSPSRGCRRPAPRAARS